MFAQRSPIVIIQNILSAIFGMTGMFFIIKYIGTTSWGFLAFGMGFVGIFTIIGDLGYSTAHTINITHGEDIEECNGTYLSIKLVMGAVFSIIVIISLFIWTEILHKGFQSPVEYWVIIALIPYFFFKNMTAFSSAYYVATLKSVRNSIPPLIEAVFRNSVFIIMALLIGTHPSLYGYIDALYLAVIYSVSYTLFFVVSIMLGRPWKIGKPTKRMFKIYSKIALPLIFALSVGTVSGNIDKVIIQFYWHATATGAFYTSQTIAALITTLSASLSMFFMPLLIKYQKTSGKEKHNESIHEFERLISLYTLPLVIPLSLLSLDVMNIFTANYMAYNIMLSLLAWRAYFSAINTPYNSAIISRKKTKLIAGVDTMLIFFNIALIFILVPPEVLGTSEYSMGPFGAAYAMLISGIASFVIYRIIVSRMEKIPFNIRLLRQALPAGVQAIFIIFIETITVPKNILILGGVTVLSIIIYTLAALLIKETSTEDLTRIAKNFIPGNIKKRFREEELETNEEFMKFTEE